MLLTYPAVLRCTLGTELFISVPSYSLSCQCQASWLGLGEFLCSASQNKPAPEQPRLPRRKTNSQHSSPNQPPAFVLPQQCLGKRHVQKRSQHPENPQKPSPETPCCRMWGTLWWGTSPVVVPDAGEGLWHHAFLKLPPPGAIVAPLPHFPQGLTLTWLC